MKWKQLIQKIWRSRVKELHEAGQERSGFWSGFSGFFPLIQTEMKPAGEIPGSPRKNDKENWALVWGTGWEQRGVDNRTLWNSGDSEFCAVNVFCLVGSGFGHWSPTGRVSAVSRPLAWSGIWPLGFGVAWGSPPCLSLAPQENKRL